MAAPMMALKMISKNPVVKMMANEAKKQAAILARQLVNEGRKQAELKAANMIKAANKRATGVINKLVKQNNALVKRNNKLQNTINRRV